MSKTFLRAVLAAFAAAGIAGAQTPPPLSPTSTPPMPAAAPVRQVAFKQVMPQPAPVAPAPVPAMPVAPIPAARMLTKVFDVADLVAPPADSPLAATSEDVAMQAAVNAYTAVRAEHLMRVVRTQVDKESWDGRGGSGRLDFHPNGCSLVVNNTAGTVARVGECLESLRRLKSPQVFVEMLVCEVASDHPAMEKLFGKKREAALAKDELTKLVRELKADGALDVLSRPQLMLTDKQTGFFQTGQQFPRLTGMTLDGKGVQQGVEYIPTGLVVRLTPDCAGDGKTMRMRTEVTLTEPSPSLIDLGNGIKAQPIDCQAIEAVLELADGGTMAVNIGTKKREQRIETKVPVLGDLPYIGRLFRTVGISHERRDTVVVFTVTRVNTEKELQQLISRQAASLAWTANRPVATPVPMPAAERPVAAVPGVLPMPVPAAMPLATGRYQQVTPIPMPIHNPFALVPPAPPVVREVRENRIEREVNSDFISGPPGFASRMPTPARMPHAIRTTGPDGLEQIGVDFNFSVIPASGSVPVTGRIAGAGHGGIPAGDETTALMKSYRAACAAGKKDEASRLALQLLAKDPTCFGRDR